jgi:hypothetical protein
MTRGKTVVHLAKSPKSGCGVSFETEALWSVGKWLKQSIRPTTIWCFLLAPSGQEMRKEEGGRRGLKSPTSVVMVKCLSSGGESPLPQATYLPAKRHVQASQPTGASQSAAHEAKSDKRPFFFLLSYETDVSLAGRT